MPSTDKPSDPARRAQILAAAEKLFRHYGPQKTTIGDIAREAEIGVGSVYLEFCSKEEIVGELAARRHDRVLSAMRAAASKGKTADRLSAALEARVEALFALSAEGAHACDLVLCSKTSVKMAYGRFRNEELGFVAELLAEGAKSGELELADSDAAETAELIQRAFATFSPPWIFEQDRRQVLRKVRTMSKLLLVGLLARPVQRRQRP